MALTTTPIELSSTPSIVDGGNATAITIDSSENISINSGDVTLATASKRYYVPRASDAAATGSLYSPTDSDIRLSGAGSSVGELQFEPSSGSGVSMSINSSGVVSLTKTGSQFTPLSYDQLVIQNGDATGIRIIDSGDGGGNGGHCGVGNDNGNLQLSTAGVMLFDTGFEATDQVYNGRHERMRIQSGGGISFNGDTAAANALDDYEEGTWTATLSSSGGSFAASATSFTGGTYTKIGNMVTAQIYSGAFNITNAGSGYAKISGLPFTALTSSTSYGSVIFYHTTCFANASPTGYVASSTDFTISSIGDQSTTNAQSWKVANSVYFMVQVQYTTA